MHGDLFQLILEQESTGREAGSHLGFGGTIGFPGVDVGIGGAGLRQPSTPGNPSPGPWPHSE